ncbi:MAG: hypothetical protein UX77_C0009G0027 [Parcubacteria group bacterium GW2011_GWA1_47_11]|nr:MAG: hypothetical protein UX77_C0009G0027 [Parcubacteria group bacterium GW2011_GWA1_47_11]
MSYVLAIEFVNSSPNVKAVAGIILAIPGATRLGTTETSSEFRLAKGSIVSFTYVPGQPKKITMPINSEHPGEFVDLATAIENFMATA